MSLAAGQQVTFQRSFSQSDFDRFARLTGDDNPIHVDPEFSARTRFGRTVAHGMLLYSTICRVLSQRLPGPGMLQVQQEMTFKVPTFTDQQVTVHVAVLSTHDALAELATTVTLPDGGLACEGKSRVYLPGHTSGFAYSDHDI